MIESVKAMERLFGRNAKARSIDVLIDGEKMATIGKGIRDQAQRILLAGHHNLGSIQGRLEAINVHQSPIATIWDRVSGAAVRWTFPPDEIDRVKELLDKRVIVSGDIHYFSNGVPRSITDVMEIEDNTPGEYAEKAGFGAIPDRRVQEIGAVEWLKEVRGFGDT